MIGKQDSPPATPKIMIVEDEPVVAMDLQRSLTKLGYLVTGVADTGPKAVYLTEATSPDLVLMDVQLRGAMDGIATAGEIQRRWEIPVIYTTAHAEDDTLERAKATGPFGFLVKPFRARELYATVTMALEQRRLSQEVLEGRAWLKTILASIRDGVIATDATGKVKFMNPAAEQLTGWRFSEAAGRPTEEVYQLLDANRYAVQPSWLRALAVGLFRSKVRLVLVHKDGRKRPIEEATAPIRDAQGRMVGAVTAFFDITERMRMEQMQRDRREELEEQVALTAKALGSTRTELQALAKQLMTAQEEERRRIARDLHDDAGQRVAFLRFEAERLGRQAATEELRAGLQKIGEEASRLSSHLRNLSHQLHPSVLEHLGLPAALRSLVEDSRVQGLDVTLHLGVMAADSISLEVGTSLYRIAQEALRNVWKYAQGATVDVHLREERRQIQLTVEDTGPGFDIDQVRAGSGLGLLSMQERARGVGGSFLLRSDHGGGTVLIVRIPNEADR